ncbi:MAG: polysaccharide biosynthesis protein [Gemmatimonadetes bacterium]|nr:polysaccharide biosynthesis protein [Gemmatimonadota bacterium]
MGVAAASAVMAMAVQGFLTRTLGARSFGEYAYSLNVVNFLAMLAVLGFEVTALRFVASYRAVEQWSLLRGYARRSLQITLALSLAVALGLVLVARFLPAVADKAVAPVLLAAALLLPLLVGMRILAANLQGLQRAVSGQCLQGLLRPLLLAVGLGLMLLAAHSRPTPVTLMLINVASTALTAGLLWLLFRRVAPRGMWDASPEFRTAEWLRVTGPLFLIAVSQTLLTSTDTLMLGTMSGTTAAGYYSVASQVASAVAFTITAVNGIVAPMIAELHAQKRYAELQRMIRLASAGSLIVATPVLLILVIFGRPIMGLFGPAFVQGLSAMLILSVGQFSVVAFGSVGFLMTMTGREGEASRIILISAVVNVALNALLIPHFGMAGSASATAFSILLRSLMLTVRVRTAVGVSAGVLAFLPGYPTKRSRND